jgi:hypothetical protein
LSPCPPRWSNAFPNFSEGRDAAKVDAIVEAMKIPGVYLLDREMDPDHNRSVITIAGEREAVLEAAIRGVGKAAELIDLNTHQGAHPRMGAADVVPFIPIDGVTLADCVAMAKQAASEIWKRYGVPVYLYEAAAAHAGAAEPRAHSPRPVRGHPRRHRDEPGANARLRRGRTACDRRRHGRRGAQGAHRLQHFSLDNRRRHRQEDCQGGALLDRRAALRQGRGLPGARAGAGLDESHRL